MTSQVVQVTYMYNMDDERQLSVYLEELEKRVGGKREPYGSRWGAIDLVPFLEIAIAFVAGLAAESVIAKYFEGLFNSEAAKNLGEKHRKQIEDWFSKLSKKTLL